MITKDHTIGREIVGKVRTSKGEYTMVLLQLRDVMDLYSPDCKVPDNDKGFITVGRSIGIPDDEFLSWDINDALEVIKFYSEVQEKLKA